MVQTSARRAGRNTGSVGNRSLKAVLSRGYPVPLQPVTFHGENFADILPVGAARPASGPTHPRAAGLLPERNRRKDTQLDDRAYDLQLW